ncbi:MAG TPA: ABC transporter permease [Thermoanaerobaculia bacterium]|nr:ABC transporter permease [Thermoanaerobaculia bacterium]
MSLLPYDTWGWNSNVRYEGRPASHPTELPLVENRYATPGFFRVTGQRPLAGRLLQPGDDERDEAPTVVVVNAALVRRDFPGDDPVGRRFHLGSDGMATIVGVVSDIRNFGPVRDPQPEMYWPYRQVAAGQTGFPMMVRLHRGDPSAVAGAVRAAVRRVDPGAAISRLRPMPEVIADSVGRPRFYLGLLAAFACVALVLAMAGLFGVLSYAVAQRTRELGIRAALGNTVGRTVALVTRQGMRLVSLGVMAGLAGGWAASRLLESLLYGVSPLDAPTWLLAVCSLLAAGALAALVPALRAARIAPSVAMRGD